MGSGHGDANTEIKALYKEALKEAIAELVQEFKAWLGALLLKVLAWASVAAAVALIGWAISRSNP